MQDLVKIYLFWLKESDKCLEIYLFFGQWRTGNNNSEVYKDVNIVLLL
jgi:hypothetical protein